MSDGNQPPQPPVGGSGGGPRTLGGASADTALPAGWGKKEKKLGRVGEWSSEGSTRRPGEIATLGNTGGQSARPMPGGFGNDDDDDDEDDEDDARRGEKEWYTGGEKSGLAVENPNKPGSGKGPKGIVQEILKQAAVNTPKREEQQAVRTGFFGGSGNTLGSDETPSAPAGGSSNTSASAPAAQPRVAAVSSSSFDQLLSGMMGRATAPAPPPAATVNDEQDEEEEEQEVQTRSLIFWKNGFSIEDGPLMEYNAPGNPELLRAIQSGRAPPSLFGVRYNQPLQVEVAQRTNEEYVVQKKKETPFGGEGNRLGNVTPEVRPASTPATATAAAGGMVSQGAGTGNTPKFQVDESMPTTNIQLRLADGSKLVAKVNLTHTIRDLRNFIIASQPGSAGRAFVLQTTFPNKELTDDSQTIEAAGLKNAVVVQRFT